MKITPHIVLLAGILGSVAAGWGGFMLGGGSRSSAFAPGNLPGVADKQPGTADTTTKRIQPQKAPFPNVKPSVEAASAGPMPEISKMPPQVATAGRSESAAGTKTPEAAATPRMRLRVNNAEQAPPRYPLVMMELPADFLNAQPGVAAAVERLREKFIAEVGGTGQNPADPAYRARWSQGVASIEDQLRAAVGWEVYNQMQAAAYYAQKAAQ